MRSFSDTIIAVPARNEAKRLPRLVRALDQQGGLAGRLRLLVLLNNCTDGSRTALARALGEAKHVEGQVREVVLPPAFATAGMARRLAMDAALTTLARDGAPLHAGAVLTTDADAKPAPDWVAANLRALAAGADLVGGRVRGASFEAAGLPEGVCARAADLARYQDRMTAIEAAIDPIAHDPWPRHGDTLGASLAIRASVYRGIGGLPPRRCQEDLALAEAVRCAGGRVRRCPHVRVTASARTCGRAQGGMAETLARWVEDDAAGRPLLVPDPSRSIALFAARAALRQAFEAYAPGVCAGPDGLTEAALLACARSGGSGLGRERVERAWRHGPTADAFVTHLMPADAVPSSTPLNDAAAFVEAWWAVNAGDAVRAEPVPHPHPTTELSPRAL